MLGRIGTLLAQLAEAAGSVVGLRVGTEEPRHTVEWTGNGLQIRHYEPRIAAQTVVSDTEEGARNRGFRRLAGCGLGRLRSAVAHILRNEAIRHRGGFKDFDNDHI